VRNRRDRKIIVAVLQEEHIQGVNAALLECRRHFEAYKPGWDGGCAEDP